ncbi:MCE family protein [Spirillospora sp. NPDC047279]|uniref:MCE family protein n=1 Tax=Spirillospora sp. NPDC047279 TaxID=3155478 RepID=UPI0033FA2958
MSAQSERSTLLQTTGRRLLGVAFLLVPALLIWLSISIYQKRFTEVTKVTLMTGTAGHEMHQQADVKVRGVVVGEVRSIKANGSGARLELALDPDKAKFVPADVRAQLLPTTVFGARYVALVPATATGAPAGTTVAQPIANDAVISEDRSQNAVELSEVLNNTMRLLNAVQPSKLSATLTAMAQALEGRGDQIGRNFAQLDSFLAKLNPELPALNRNLAELATFADNLNAASPDLLQALTDFTTTSRTIAEQRQNLADLYETVSTATGDLTEFVSVNSENLIALATESRGSLHLFRRYSPAAPCTFRTLADFIPKMNEVLGKGTDKHGVHGQVVSVQHQGRYIPGKDKVRYDGGGGPRCYSVPYTPGGGKAPTAVPTGAKVPGAVTTGGLGPANSTAENDLVNQLVAPGLDEVPEELPDWSSVLVGPIYRGAEVTVK